MGTYKWASCPIDVVMLTGSAVHCPQLQQLLPLLQPAPQLPALLPGDGCPLLQLGCPPTAGGAAGVAGVVAVMTVLTKAVGDEYCCCCCYCCSESPMMTRVEGVAGGQPGLCRGG